MNEGSQYSEHRCLFSHLFTMSLEWLRYVELDLKENEKAKERTSIRQRIQMVKRKSSY